MIPDCECNLVECSCRRSFWYKNYTTGSPRIPIFGFCDVGIYKSDIYFLGVLTVSLTMFYLQLCYSNPKSFMRNLEPIGRIEFATTQTKSTYVDFIE